VQCATNNVGDDWYCLELQRNELSEALFLVAIIVSLHLVDDPDRQWSPGSNKEY